MYTSPHVNPFVQWYEDVFLSSVINMIHLRINLKIPTNAQCMEALFLYMDILSNPDISATLREVHDSVALEYQANSLPLWIYRGARHTTRRKSNTYAATLRLS